MAQINKKYLKNIRILKRSIKQKINQIFTNQSKSGKNLKINQILKKNQL